MAEQLPKTPDPRYPIGRFTKPETITPALRAEYIAILEQAPANFRTIVSKCSDAQLETPYREGGWTARQLIHHMADSHLNLVERVRLSLTEDWPTIKPYSEKLWATLHDAKTAPINLSLDLLDALHARLVILLRSLTEEQWNRGYKHPENGPATLQTIVGIYAWHCRHHAAHLTVLVKNMGWSE